VYLEATNVKREAINKAKAAHFKQAVAKDARKSKGMWPLANGQKQKVTFPRLPLQSQHSSPLLEMPQPLLTRLKL
jgi:hypothetical protein